MYVETNPLYSAPDDLASEFEVFDFLYAMVRMYKPKVVVETGCYRGDASVSIGKALVDNKLGILYTCDVEPDLAKITEGRTMYMPVVVQNVSGEALCREVTADFAFLDSSGNRVEEARHLKLNTHGIVCLHDANRRHVYNGIKNLRNWRKVWDLPNPRGLAVFFS